MRTGIMIAPNGARLLHSDHEKLPLKQEQIVKTAISCEKAGAQAIHLHVRDDNFNHVLDLKRYKDTIKSIKKECTKDFIVQATTEAVSKYKPDEMISLIKQLKPEATSVAIKEILPSNDNINELKEAKAFYSFSRSENIGVQHILYSSDDLKKFHKLLEQEIITGEKHSILFVLGRYSKSQIGETKDLIPYLKTLKELNLEDKVNWMLCAFGEHEIPSLVSSSVLGGHCRIGFENSRVLPSGIKANNNESQVDYLKQILDLLNIKKVNTSEIREILGIFK